jgi:signal transduction histidine kinase/ligand-binding sensor domain-containing protein
MENAAPARVVKLAAVAVALAVARTPAMAQTRALIEPPEFAVDRWTTRDGLPQNSVNAIAQTPDGYLWLGTFGGLARFDGSTFTVAERVDSSGRHVDRILALAVGPDSALWVGTETGLLRYHHGSFTAYTTAQGLADNEIAVLHVDRRGILWVGMSRGGIARYDGGRFQTWREKDGVPLRNVSSISEDQDGTLWVNVGDRFVTFAAGRPAGTPPARRRPEPGLLNLMLQDRAGALWFSRSDGVARLAGGVVSVFDRAAGLQRPSTMVEDPGGGYWLGTNNDGLLFVRIEHGRAAVRRYPLPDGRDAYRVRTAYLDRDGYVWFGTNANGLLRARRNLFTTYTSAQGLSNDVTTAVFGDAGGRIWVGTNCWGLNAIDALRRTVRVFKPRRSGDPAGDPCVFAITEAPRGTLWVGTWGGGLTRLDGDREVRLRSAGTGLRDSVVLALFTDRDGTVWVGTNSGGLAQLEDGRVRATYTTSEGLAHNSVRTIYQTRDGAIWIGTLGGLSRLRDGRITSYTAAQGLSAQHVRAIYEDADGTLWIGTYGGGLNRLRDGAFTAITPSDGLADDVVSAILEDEYGRFWMSGNRGISRVARSELIAFAERRQRRVHAVLYREADGLQNAETNGGFEPAGWKDAAGRLWFPTVRGVAVVDPARVSRRERAPAVRLEDVVVNGVSRQPRASIEIGGGRPNLEFRYTGLSLVAPQHLTFRYQLQGFDEDWVEAGARRVAYYPRLPAGQYRLVVTAGNRDGVWSEAGTELRLRVLAPFWSTWWFRVLAAATLLGLALVLVRRRELAARRWRTAQQEFSRRLIESQERERKRIAGELHDGLGQELLVVKNRALLALKADGLQAPVRDQLQQIHEVATTSLENVRGLAHNLTPYQLDHLGLTAALRTMIAAAADTTEIAFSVTVEDIDGLLPVASQINLFRIVQEAVTNLVRHSGARTASVYVRRDGATVAATIKDDGRGFELRRDSAGRLALGFGWSGIAERVRILGGQVEIVSAPDRGTRIELSAPVGDGAAAG